MMEVSTDTRADGAVLNNFHETLFRNITFVCGVVTGFIAANLVTPRYPGRHHKQSVVDELVQEIQLAPAQKEQVVHILAETRRQYADTPQKYAALLNNFQLGEIRRATRQQIRALLTPEQQNLFDEWALKRDARRN